MRRGGCLCGAVTFELCGEPREPAACHCTQCRRQSGHFWAAAAVARDEIAIDGEVAWYEASPRARRGFCPRCGSFLFWEPREGDSIEFALGALDAPTGLRLEAHIFVAEKGDYYDIADGLAQRERG
ncbi:MAG: GFA family protein [Roseovarius sp.]